MNEWTFLNTQITEEERWNWYKNNNNKDKFLRVPVSRHGLECLVLAEEIIFGKYPFTTCK